MPNSPGNECSAESQEASAMQGVADELREWRKMRAEGSFSPQAIIKLDSGGMGNVLGWVSAGIAVMALVILVIVIVWLNGEINTVNQRFTDLNNNDRVHDAYLRQYGDRVSRLESTKEQKPAK